MNPIAQLTTFSLQTHIDKSRNKLEFYESLKKVCRIIIPFLGFSLLLTFGLLNPNYLPISSSLLLVAYTPCLEVTIGSLEAWSYEIRIDIDKNALILEGLRDGKPIFQAWIDAIPDTPLPQAMDLEEAVRQFPSSEETRKNLWEFKKSRTMHRLENTRKAVERAYVEYIRNHQDDRRSLSDFGSYKKWQIEYLMDDLPFTVFVTKQGREFQNLDDFSRIFTG